MNRTCRTVMPWLMALAILGPVPAAPAEPGPAPLVAAINHLGLATLAEQVAAAPARTQVISPLGLAGTLLLLTPGTAGTTAATLLPLLGSEAGADPAAAAAGLGDAWRTLLGTLAAPSGQPESGFTWAAGLWHAPNAPIDAPARDRLTGALAATVAGVEFAAGTGADPINAWVAAATGGLIPTLFDRLPATTELVGAGALAFKAAWATAFDPKETVAQPFYPNGPDVVSVPVPVPVPMMTRTDPAFLYRREPTYQAILLPYADPDYVLALALPRGEDAALPTAPDSAWWRPEGYRSRPGRLVLPRLSVSLTTDLTDPKAAPTLARLFGAPMDLSGYGAAWAQAPRALDQAIQAVALRWDEAGTVAAAATAFTISRSFEIDDNAPFVLVFDRPFQFVLWHRPSGVILVAGRVANVTDAK